MRVKLSNSCGFTLVELMITIGVSVLLVAVLYATYTIQQRSYVTQGQVAEMQQNVRSGIDFLTLDLRMAGYDPLDRNIGGITSAGPNYIGISADMDENGELGTSASPASENEYFGFYVYTSPSTGVSTLGRTASIDTKFENNPTTGAGWSPQPLADNIEHVEFNYILEDGSEKPNPLVIELGDIRAIQVSILARTSMRDSRYTKAETFVTPSGANWTKSADGFRRRLITTQIDLRNMGL